MPMNGVLADGELVTNLLVAVAGRDEPQDFQLAVRQSGILPRRRWFTGATRNGLQRKRRDERPRTRHFELRVQLL